MANKIFLQKRYPLNVDEMGLFPYYSSDVNDFQKITQNVVYCYEYFKPRNPLFHKKVFAIARTVIENSSEGSAWNGKEPKLFIKSCMWEAGITEIMQLIGGEVKLIPKSIKFSEMDNEEFEKVYQAVLKYGSMILGITEEELEDEIDYRI